LFQPITDIRELKRKANAIRQDIIRMLGAAGSGHPGGSLSATDIVTALFFNVLRHDPERPDWRERDRFILAKGHAAPVLYSAYMESGYVSRDLLLTLRKLGSPFQGHPDKRFLPILEASTGSLGQGLSIAIGEALACRLDHLPSHVFVMIGDGEMQEGQVWEAAFFCNFHKVDNLTCILDYNRIQLDGWVKEIMEIAPVPEKWRSFGWHIIEIDGHDMEQVLRALKEAREIYGKPKMIVAHTVKGKGVSFMENVPKWHGVAPNAEETSRALAELEAQAAAL